MKSAGPRNNDDPHDPLSGYRPDMDQHPEPEDSTSVTIVWMVLPGIMIFCVVMGVILATYLF